MSNNVYICDGIRTPIGRYGGSLAGIRSDDLAALPLTALMQRNPQFDWSAVDDIILGCANQAGEDNRNVARMAALLAGLPKDIAAVTINRLCGSGLNAIGSGAQAIRAGEAELMIVGGVESMSRAPYVMAKAATPFDRKQTLYDTTMGWRFINKKLQQHYGTDSMPQTAEHCAQLLSISREAQDRFALWSQNKARAAQQRGDFDPEIVPVAIANTATKQSAEQPLFLSHDEQLRNTNLEKLNKLTPLFENGSITAGNASSINDGAAALLIASEAALTSFNLQPRARILGMAVAGVEPKTMGLGPVPAINKLLKRLTLTLDDFDLLEFNEAFAAQVLSCTRSVNLDDQDPRINPQGGAIALGHPLGMSGSRLVITAFNKLHRPGGKRALCAMCVGVGQGVALAIEGC